MKTQGCVWQHVNYFPVCKIFLNDLIKYSVFDDKIFLSLNSVLSEENI